MKKRMSKLPFHGTPEQEAQLKELIAAHKGEKGALMPVMQAVPRHTEILY